MVFLVVKSFSFLVRHREIEYTEKVLATKLAHVRKENLLEKRAGTKCQKNLFDICTKNTQFSPRILHANGYSKIC